eukprot:TRINITY_DN4990_c0_g1_i9.p2 TRINITY_DN4990_c0_g1~~TRINITY_DN4990_c0_g1_i9.p2  ORF type:complete len:224 (-),score=19.81 TRINITY_DN4990_c0_g1_i9:12-683(-)
MNAGGYASVQTGEPHVHRFHQDDGTKSIKVVETMSGLAPIMKEKCPLLRGAARRAAVALECCTQKWTVQISSFHHHRVCHIEGDLLPFVQDAVVKMVLAIGYAARTLLGLFVDLTSDANHTAVKFTRRDVVVQLGHAFQEVHEQSVLLLFVLVLMVSEAFPAKSYLDDLYFERRWRLLPNIRNGRPVPLAWVAISVPACKTIWQNHITWAISQGSICYCVRIG